MCTPYMFDTKHTNGYIDRDGDCYITNKKYLFRVYDHHHPNKPKKQIIINLFSNHKHDHKSTHNRCTRVFIIKFRTVYYVYANDNIC